MGGQEGEESGGMAGSDGSADAIPGRSRLKMPGL